MEIRLWIRLKYKTVQRALEALLMAGDHEHQKARETFGAESKNHRMEAEEFHAAKSDLWNASHRDDMKNCSDESVHGNSAPVQITRFSLPKDARELIIAVVMAGSVLTNVVLWSKLHDAEKDIQTQVWLRDDALTKFQQGPFADLKAHVIADEINCRKEKP